MKAALWVLVVMSESCSATEGVFAKPFRLLAGMLSWKNSCSGSAKNAAAPPGSKRMRRFAAEAEYLMCRGDNRRPEKVARGSDWSRLSIVWVIEPL